MIDRDIERERERDRERERERERERIILVSCKILPAGGGPRRVPFLTAE